VHDVNVADAGDAVVMIDDASSAATARVLSDLRMSLPLLLGPGKRGVQADTSVSNGNGGSNRERRAAIELIEENVIELEP
jgi:hypothetical protein